MSDRNSTCSSERPVGHLVAGRRRRTARARTPPGRRRSRPSCASSRTVPSRRSRTASRASTRWGWSCRRRTTAPCSQKKQPPQAMVNGTTTRSPTFSFLIVCADLDDLAHELMAEDVAALHRRDEAVEQVQVGAADGGEGDLDDRVARIQDLRIRNPLDAHVVRAIPAQSFHTALRLQEPTLAAVPRSSALRRLRAAA